jgi:hypothetical protein
MARHGNHDPPNTATSVPALRGTVVMLFSRIFLLRRTTEPRLEPSMGVDV